MLQEPANTFTCFEFFSVCHAGLVFFQMICLSLQSLAVHPFPTLEWSLVFLNASFTTPILSPHCNNPAIGGMFEGKGAELKNMEEFLSLFALVEKAVRVADSFCVRNTLSSHSFYVREGPLSTTPWRVYTILLFTGLCSTRILFLSPEFSHIRSSFNSSSVKLLNRFPSLYISNAFLPF